MRKRYWHFVGASGRLNHGDGRKVVVGKTLSVEGDIVACENALHAGITPLAALRYAPSDAKYICRVELWGDTGQEEDDGIVYGRYRKVLWMVDCERILHGFAIWCAEEALKLIQDPDPRSLKAIEVKRKWLDDKATDKELAAARVAAWAASAAAGAAAGAAEWTAEWAAAGAAAGAAEWAAEWAARAAGVAGAAARAKQNRKLTKMLTEARKMEVPE